MNPGIFIDFLLIYKISFNILIFKKFFDNKWFFIKKISLSNIFNFSIVYSIFMIKELVWYLNNFFIYFENNLLFIIN